MISHYLPLALIYLAYPAVKTMACWRAALPFGWERGFCAHGPIDRRGHMRDSAGLNGTIYWTILYGVQSTLYGVDGRLLRI